MSCSPQEQRLISVFETTLSVQQDVLSVFNVVIQDPTSIVSLVRYPFDFVEFHQKIRHHYPRSKIPFPVLSTPTAQVHRLSKRKSFRNLLAINRKSNADKLEKYLHRCFEHPIISISTILRDFLSVQREEDKHISCSNRPCSPPPSPPEEPPTPQYKAAAAFIQEKPSLQDYELLKVLGQGCMGKVLLVRSRKDRQLFALKAIKKQHVIQQKELQHMQAERDILAQLRDKPFLVKLHCAFQTSSQLMFVLDYYSGGDIATQMALYTTFSEERTLFYAAEILDGLSTLHKYGIIYRDLKPENVLINRDGHVALTDFGLSKYIGGPQARFSADDDDKDELGFTRTFCGTAEYLAPEVLLGEPYTFVVDYWSLGTLLYEMLAGTTPFWAETNIDMYRRVLDDPLEFPDSFNKITCDFLAGLLEREPTERLGWDGPDQIKAHPYFARIDWDDVAAKRLQPPYIPHLSSETDVANFDEAFVNMTPRVSESSSIVDDTCSAADGEDDPFANFSFDPTDEAPPSLAPLRIHNKQKLQRVQQKKLKDRFSSSSSLLSFSNSEVVRHTDTMPSILTRHINTARMSAAHLRNRHSAVLSIKNVDDDDDADRPSSKIIDPINLHSMHHHQLNNTNNIVDYNAAARDPPHVSVDVDDDAVSLYSKSSITLSSSAHVTIRGGSEVSDLFPQQAAATSFLRKDSSHHQQQPSPYERPQCPEPGQLRPHISFTSDSSVATSPNRNSDSLCLSESSTNDWQQQFQSFTLQ